MHIEPNQLYHIYNQGNNRQPLFIDESDYQNFLKRLRRHVVPFCDILAYVLMPNHFHFLVNTDGNSSQSITLGNIEVSQLSNGFRLLCSQYAMEFNKRHGRSGSLFRQKTKAKRLKGQDQAFICFQYIHQNPLKAGLTDSIQGYPYSSFIDYLNMTDGGFCNRNLAYNLLDVAQEDFLAQSHGVVINQRLLNSILK